MSFIPRNARQLLRNNNLMRDFALKPFGFNIPQNCHVKKTHPEYKFFQHKIVLHRPGDRKPVEPQTLVFKVDQNLSKPQIKQYLQKLYNLKITKVNTARFMGKVYKTANRRCKITPSFKKAFVITEHKVPEFLNKSVL